MTAGTVQMESHSQEVVPLLEGAGTYPKNTGEAHSEDTFMDQCSKGSKQQVVLNKISEKGRCTESYKEPPRKPHGLPLTTEAMHQLAQATPPSFFKSEQTDTQCPLSPQRHPLRQLSSK